MNTNEVDTDQDVDDAREQSLRASPDTQTLPDIPTLPDRAPKKLEALGRLLNNATRNINQVAETKLAEHDITLPQWAVLTALWRADGLMVSHLAAYCDNGQPALSRILDRMESKGFVERRAAVDDRRSVRVFLTPKSKKLSHLIDNYQHFNDVMMKDFSSDEKAQLFTLLRRLIANGDEANAT